MHGWKRHGLNDDNWKQSARFNNSEGSNEVSLGWTSPRQKEGFGS